MTTKTNWRETQQHTPELERVVEEFRKQFDELGLKPPKNSMPNMERELIIDFWRKTLTTYATSQVLKREGEMVELFEKKLITAYRKGVVDEQMQRNTEKEVVAYALQPFIPTPKDELAS